MNCQDCGRDPLWCWCHARTVWAEQHADRLLDRLETEMQAEGYNTTFPDETEQTHG